ncbi:MAG: histidine kinase [Steroidobacteraceae bacterium]
MNQAGDELPVWRARPPLRRCAAELHALELLMARDNPVRLPSFWQLQITGWVGLYLVRILGSIPDIFRRPGALRGTTVAIGSMFLASFALRPLCRSLLPRAPSWLAFAWRAAAWSMVWGTATTFAATLILGGFQKLDWPSVAGSSVQFAFMFFLWCSLYLSVKQWQQSVHERERLLRAETEARDARLSALRYQLNPHFLFNSLNAVSTLVLDGNAPAATQMLAQIGEFLRTSLDNKVVSEVTLFQEMAFTERYLAIEQTRMGERLQVNWAISSETLDGLVPSMLLQPLVENAVRHGVVPIVEGGRIAIESGLHRDRMRIVIRNSGPRSADKQTENGKGIGLNNTRERLLTQYGVNHTFLVEWPEVGGCQVTVELPFERAADIQEALPCEL